MAQYDVVVIGSGAAGSVMAYRLARAGLRVVVLERGKREDTSTFSQNEFDMLPRLYKYGGMQTTADNAITIMQGQTLGGSTVINNAIWIRPDLDRLLPAWAAAGAHVDRARLEHAYGDLERALHVEPIPPALMNAGTSPFQKGCAALGLTAETLSHNRDTCLGCGFCNFGCRYDRKTSMLVTFIPWAESRGAYFIDQVRHVSLVQKGDQVVRVDYERFGRRYGIEADSVVVACGAIGSSELLIQNQIKSKAVIGAGFHLLGGALVVAEMPEKLDSFKGIGLTCMLKGSSSDFLVENFFAPPASFAASLNGFFETHAERMQRYAYLAQAGVMVATEPTGRIEVGDDGTKINLQLSSADLDHLKKGIKQLCQIFLAGGAKATYPGVYADATFTRASDLDELDRMVQKPEDLLFGSAHPQGGNPMSEDPKRGVVGVDFRVHGYRNLFVADASLFPTNLHANCQATTMGMSYLAADHVLGRGSS